MRFRSFITERASKDITEVELSNDVFDAILKLLGDIGGRRRDGEVKRGEITINGSRVPAIVSFFSNQAQMNSVSDSPMFGRLETEPSTGFMHAVVINIGDLISVSFEYITSGTRGSFSPSERHITLNVNPVAFDFDDEMVDVDRLVKFLSRERTIVRSTFVHEFQHLRLFARAVGAFDRGAITKINDKLFSAKTADDQRAAFVDYQSNPNEFNSHYEQMLHTILDDVRRMVNLKVSPPRFDELFPTRHAFEDYVKKYHVAKVFLHGLKPNIADNLDRRIRGLYDELSKAGDGPSLKKKLNDGFFRGK